VTYAERVAADRRLIILRFLVEIGGRATESAIERTLIDLGEGLGLDRTIVRQFLKDLEERDCVVIAYHMDKLMIADITKRGVAVAEGRVRVDGVAKPSLGV